MMTALLSVGAWAADDLTLNPSETVSFGEWGFNNSAAPTLNFSNWAAGGGWQFATPLSQDDYCGVEIAFNATTETHVTFFIDYEGGAEQSIDVPKGSTGIKAGFAFTGSITKIGFKYSDHEATANENGASITITSAVVKANSTGEVVELSFADLSEPGEGSEDYTKDAATQSITINQYKWVSYWSFNPAINSDDYEKIVITFAEAVPVSGLTINAEVTEDASWNGTAIGSIAKDGTKATAYFSALPGASITRVGFHLDWNAASATLKIASAKLIKKPTQSITIGSMTHGTVTASVTEAWEGKTVILTPVPDGNYALGTLTVTDESSNEITVMDNGGGTYSFTMPATAVTVSATFTHDDNLTLSTDKILCFNSTGGRVTEQRYYTDSHTLWVGDGEHNGWDLTIGRTATTEEFTGVTISFSDKQNIQLEIAYNDGSDKTYTKDLSSETSPVAITFSEAGITGVLKSIMFARKVPGDSKIVFNNETSVKMQIAGEATYPTPRSSMTLTYETLEDTGNSSVTYDTENKTFTIAGGDDAHWAFWDFILPLPTSLYNGINFNLTQAPAGSKIEIIYDGDGDNPQQVSIAEAVSSETNFNVNFDRTGNVTRIRFAGAGTYKMGTCTAKPAKYQVTVSAAKYATFGDLGSPDVINYGSADPSGLKAYIAYVEDSKVKLEEVSKATANTAVILYADVETATSYTVNTTNESVSTTTHTNQLHISDGTVKGSTSNIYVLANKTSHGVGFYKLESDVTVPAGKAYLQIGESLAHAFIGIGDDATGIDEVGSKREEVRSDYYDLQGRRVAQPTKGLYIVNGKKVIIK